MWWPLVEDYLLNESLLITGGWSVYCKHMYTRKHAKFLSACISLIFFVNHRVFIWLQRITLPFFFMMVIIMCCLLSFAHYHIALLCFHDCDFVCIYSSLAKVTKLQSCCCSTTGRALYYYYDYYYFIFQIFSLCQLTLKSFHDSTQLCYYSCCIVFCCCCFFKSPIYKLC